MKLAGFASSVMLLLALFAAKPASAAEQRETARTQCEVCHSGLGRTAAALPAVQFRQDVHADRGFTCVDCHGGDPTATDKTLAKGPKTGYRGRPTGAAIITTCARCHSDAELMRRYAPKQRVDQASEYATSGHGKQLAAGDSRVATCISCHGAHGIRMVSDARSPVYPLNVATTCASCHSNTEYMKAERTEAGTPLPTNQLHDYRNSVHYRALTKGNDLSAPTCNDCHGNHGAAPPGVGAVANVCGTCHAVFATRFEQSTHKPIFDRACVECHNNHAVEPSSDEMLGSGAKAICVTCHSPGDNGLLAAEKMRGGIERLKTGIAHARELIEGVENQGMEVSDQKLALAEAGNQLTLARTEIHATNPATVDPVVAAGLKIVGGVENAGQAALRELRFRRRGLFGSLAVIIVVVLALGMKIREIERRK
ncbi:MAG: cytochrome c3 family protein [Acidobacteria bacterium]|nr:cytochrome c3 family protein [Acidobacteriota bacterium]